MLGRKELAKLDLQKQALLLESGLNRVALQAEIRHLRSATAWMGEAASVSRKLTPLLIFLAPLAGFLLATSSFRAGSWLGRVVNLGKWASRLYRVWKSFTGLRSKPEAEEPAT